MSEHGGILFIPSHFFHFVSKDFLIIRIEYNLHNLPGNDEGILQLYVTEFEFLIIIKYVK